MGWTSEQAADLAEALRALAKAIRQYREDSPASISDEEDKILEKIYWSVLNQASSVNTEAVALALSESQWAFAELTGVVKNAQDCLQTLAEIKKVIAVATVAVGLVAAIVSQDPAAIAQKAKDLGETIKELEAGGA